MTVVVLESLQVLLLCAALLSAQGSYLTLETGQRILDATGGAAVACLGHGNKRIQKALMAQMDQVSYCHSLFFSNSSGEELARILIESTGGRMERALIVSSGKCARGDMSKLSWSEAMEAALKTCSFIARKESYHGATLGALSVSGHVGRRALYERMLIQNISFVSPCNQYRGKKDGESDDAYVSRLAKELDDEFHRVGPESVCAFIAEPIVGSALACMPALPGYFKAMKEVCDRHGALIIMDEIMCGMGRSGKLHAWEEEGIVPDIQTIGKGLGGGYQPIAGILMNRRVADALAHGTGVFMHGQTYQGHPVACSAAVEVQRIIKEQSLLENVVNMGNLLGRSLKARLGDHPNVGDIRGRGLFWGVEFVKDRKTKEPFDTELGLGMAIYHRGLDAEYGISLYPGSGTVDGRKGDHILIAPAYNVDEVTIDRVVDLTTRVVEDVLGKIRKQN
ncbi:aminotransferase, class III [Xylogone sp. PMI_703]|nr:aminotransferase, class III [Xylogone sp. PMI_703]